MKEKLSEILCNLLIWWGTLVMILALCALFPVWWIIEKELKSWDEQREKNIDL